MKPKIYTASKPKHAGIWRALRAQGYNIISTWIDYADDNSVTDFQKLWLDCAHEASSANIILIYLEPGDELRGTYVEMGIGIANQRRIFVLNPKQVRFTDAVNHPLVTEFDTWDSILAAVDKLSKKKLSASA